MKIMNGFKSFVIFSFLFLNVVQGRDGCDHARVITYFAESINSDVGFRAVECATEEDFIAGLCNDNPSVLMGDPTPVT
jgi:hypothetical protein